jgi:DNA-binding NtrC family response regulator
MNKESILVIDDDSALLELQKIILEMNGFGVFTAQSGEEALGLLAKIDKPHLILLDVKMEDMSGPQFLKKFEEEMPQLFAGIPVVYLSGMVEIPKGNVVGLIRKPFEMDKYIKEVHNFIELGKQVK